MALSGNVLWNAVAAIFDVAEEIHTMKNKASRRPAVRAVLLIAAAVRRSSQRRSTSTRRSPIAHVSPTLYGLMTEEINHSYDGGLYPELIRNRAFMDNSYGPHGWVLVEQGER